MGKGVLLKNKVALVTGAGRGIGKHISLELARNGSALVVNDINVADVQATANQVRSLGVKALEVVADVSNFAEVEDMVRTAVQNFSRLDILVNNAGVISTGLIQDLEIDEWGRVIDVNAISPAVLETDMTRELVKDLSPEDIDLNVSAILKGELTLDEAGDQLIDMIRRTWNGRFTVTEALGHREFVLTKPYISA